MFALSSPRGQRGSASIEHLGLILLVAMAFAGLAILTGKEGPIKNGRELGGMIGRKLKCAPLLPGPCRQDPLLAAYSTAVAKAVAALSPTPKELNRDGLVPVDFRYCRQESCATPSIGDQADRLTISNRRITAFTEVIDRRRSRGTIEVRFWLYRPGQPWEVRTALADRSTITEAAAEVRLGRDRTPRLVPLETFGARNHFRFPKAEEPPWRWQVGSIYNGRRD